MSQLDNRISQAPQEWAVPLADVIDTADVVYIALKTWKIDSPELLLGLTKLVIERHDKANPKQPY
jgi:hypothetical protein